MKIEPAVGMNVWSFTYLKGSARFTGNVEASSEDVARALAQEWCDRHSVLMGGSRVLPLVLARESDWVWREKPESLGPEAPLPADPVSATTMIQNVKELAAKK